MAKTPIRPPIRKDSDGPNNSHSYKYGYGYGYAGYGREKRPRQLNASLLLYSLVGLVIAIPAIYFWHDYQTKKLSQSLLEYGRSLDKQGRYEEASAAMYRVWEIRREPELLGEAVVVYDKYAGEFNPAGVIAAYQTAIGGLPDRLDLRIRLAEFLVRDQQFSSAFDQSEKILAKDPENLAGKKWRALSLLGLKRIQQPRDGYDVLDELKRAYVKQQADFDIAAALVSHIREDLRAQNGSELATQADGVMNRLVAANSKDVNARLARYQYRKRYGLPGAKKDIEQAVGLAPNNPAVIRPAAWSALRDAVENWKASDYLAARQLFKLLTEIAPEDEAGYLGLGDTEYLVQGNIANAIKVWTQGRAKAGDSLRLLLRIAEGQTNSFQYEEVEKTLADVDKFMASLPTRAAERNRNWAKASAALFRGKLLLAKKEPIEAIKQLRIAADLGDDLSGNSPTPFRSTDKSTSYTALMTLGKTYFQLGRFKDAASAYERALLLNPESQVAMLQGAEAWAEVGDLDRAIRNIEKAKRLRRPTVEVARAHAQYLLERELAAPSRERDWNDFQDSLKIVRSKIADSWQLRLLEADYAIHRKRINQSDNSEAMGKLLAIERDFPDELEVWKRLPFVYESMGMQADADRALNQLEKITSSSIETKLLITDLLLGRDQPDKAQQVLDSLSRLNLGPAESLAKEHAQLRILEYLGNDEAIDQKLIELRDQYKQNSVPVERLLDRRLCKVSELPTPTNPELIEDLKKRQPESESTWQYYAARLELERPKPDATKLQQYLSSLTGRLPYWSRTQELAGRISQLQQNPREAQLAFNSAISKPNPNPELVQLVIAENIRTGDFLANVRILENHEQIPAIARIVSNGGWTQLQRDLNFKVVDRGLDKTKQNSAMWNELFSRQLSRSDEPTTNQLSDLILRLWRSSQDEDSNTAQIVDQIESQEFNDSDLKAFVLGQTYHLAGRFEDAKRQFREVVESSQRRLRAEIYSGAATNQILMQRARKFELAEAEVGSKKRLGAIVKLRRGTKQDLSESRVLLQSLVNSYRQNSDRLLLAMCFEQLEEFGEAQTQLETVVESEPSAHHLATLVDFLLKQGENEKAKVWLEQLEAQTGWDKKSVMLRVRWMAATNRQQEIKPFVEMYAAERFRRSVQSAPQEMRDIASIYKSVSQVEDAERWLSMLANRFPDHSEPLSLLLVENDETDRAVRRCINQLNREPNAETATLLARILVYGDVEEETVAEVLPLLQTCREQFPDSASLLFALGNLQIKLNKKSDAIRMLTEVTQRQPGHYLAWNNLAALLAEEEGREEEAMLTINTAIEQAAYEIPTLMDTKAVVLMHQERFEAAAAILQDKVTDTQAGSDPRFYFHLAISLDRMGKSDTARDALQKAKEMQLEDSFLTEFEKTELRRLQEKLADKE